ncbi:BON domain-containing protein [Methylomonas koyamae]|uniref:BON domain-containing protein n=1 Tax=Methylomonas koyamae TaxID=702114 RepID=UPI000BC31BE9|nr:BON domain-containing protein [Methylomonas koyamae]ATG90143.1 hypothetical protein MKLM6_1910 [Methylomonas koyamae]
MNTINQHTQNKLLALSCILIALGLGACQPEHSAEKAGQKIDKAMDNVGQKIEQTNEKVGQTVDAAKQTVEQKAEQTGVAMDESAQASKDALEKAGKQFDKAINNSEKRIQGAKESIVDAGKATGEYLDDAAITAKVKTALLNDDFLKLAPIEVTTVNGVVKLSGAVDSEQLIGRAIGLVNVQEHVKSVQSELTIKAATPSKP